MLNTERPWIRLWVAWGLSMFIAVGVAVPSSSMTELKADKALVQRAMAVPWTKGNEARLKAIFDKPSRVGQFIYTLDVENLTGFLQVDHFRFISLLGDGRLQLVANNDSNGRAFYNDLIIVHRTPSGFVTEWIDGWDFSSLREHLVHLSKDGRTQILVDELMEPFAGYHLVPAFTHVYDWNGIKFVQSDGAYKGWYAKVKLPELKKGLREERARNPSEQDSDTLHAFETEIQAVEKLLKTQ